MDVLGSINLKELSSLKDFVPVVAAFGGALLGGLIAIANSFLGNYFIKQKDHHTLLLSKLEELYSICDTLLDKYSEEKSHYFIHSTDDGYQPYRNEEIKILSTRLKMLINLYCQPLKQRYEAFSIAEINFKENLWDLQMNVLLSPPLSTTDVKAALKAATDNPTAQPLYKEYLQLLYATRCLQGDIIILVENNINPKKFSYIRSKLTQLYQFAKRSLGKEQENSRI